MAKTLWGNVYYQDWFAGRIAEEPSGRCVFTYDTEYINNEHPRIAHSMPVRAEPFISDRGLHPFFDNLIAEGWFRRAQAKALGVDFEHRFALLLGFGYDLAGAVSVVDPDPREHHTFHSSNESDIIASLGRASLSGIQRKLLFIQDGAALRPTRAQERSTHIAKLSSGHLYALLELEYLTTLAVKNLLPDDSVVPMEIIEINAIHEPALVIPRFDRNADGTRSYHFEEFNALLGHRSGDSKYDGSYESMGQFILKTPECIPTEAYILFKRILACFLVGNTDAHFKNFAMFHTRNGLRLTPLYDIVASSIYPEYRSIALTVSGIRDLSIQALKSKHLISMGAHFGLDEAAVTAIAATFAKQLPYALSSIEQSTVGTLILRKQLIEIMEKRWNGSFALIGRRLLKKQNNDAKRSA